MFKDTVCMKYDPALAKRISKGRLKGDYREYFIQATRFLGSLAREYLLTQFSRVPIYKYQAWSATYSSGKLSDIFLDE